MEHVFTKIACLISSEDDYSSQLFRAIKLSKHWNSELLFIYTIHDGEAIQDEVHEFVNANFPYTKINHIQTGNSTQLITPVLKEYEIELLIVQSEPEGGELKRYYNESINRQLIRNVDCSVLIARQNEAPANYDNLVVNGFDHPKSKYTIGKATKIGRSFKVRSMLIMNQRSKSDEPLDYSKQKFDKDTISVQEEAVDKKGYSISEFVKSKKADLLIMSTPDTKLGYEGRVFTDELDYLISELPTDILLIHSTKPISDNNSMLASL